MSAPLSLPILILAAGASTRMRGRDKLMEPVEGRPLIRRQAEMARAAGRFPVNTPVSKEAYWFRSVFEQHFPLASAAQCVPGGPTVACSTPEAVLWDKALQEMNDPSGRAMKNVHKDSY